MPAANFLMINLIISVYCIAVAAIKRFLTDKISAKLSYFMYVPFIILALSIFIPQREALYYAVNRLSENNLLYGVKMYADLPVSNDLYVSVNKSRLPALIYLPGFAVNLLATIWGLFRLKKEIKDSQMFKNSVFDKCCAMVGKKAELYAVNKNISPFSFGIIHRYIVVPKHLLKCNDEKLTCIFTHELIHHKNGDIAVNCILYFISMLYWINPFVYLAIKDIRLDMEIYCDYCTVNYLGDYKGYGAAIIDFIENKRKLSIISNISGAKRDVKIRLIKLMKAANQNIKASNKANFFAAFAVTVITAFAVCSVNAFGYSSSKSKAVNSREIDLSGFFEKYEGCFAAYSLNEGRYITYNRELCMKRAAPDSTYKIAIALNSLENGIITKDNNGLSWDGTKYPFASWNSAQNLNSAMKYSVNWYFQNIDKRIEQGKIKGFLRSVKYGNQNVGFDRDSYWLENTLAISPLEQVDFLKGIYLNEFNLAQNNVDIVLNSIKVSENLYAKTGTGQINGKTCNGWYIGIYETDKDTYIFAVRIMGEDNASGSAAEKIAGNILSIL